MNESTFSQAVPGRQSGRLAGLTPNWFASVMGTGIVSIVAARLPDQFTGSHILAVAAWLIATGLLVVFVFASLSRVRSYPHSLRDDIDDPVMAHFYGAVPMAMLTVGAATLLVGNSLVGMRLAIDIDWVLWFAGTITGLMTAVAVPILTFTHHRVGTESAFGGWLMPIVPPMVSASTGALLIPYAPAGQGRLDLLLCCYGMFGASLIASLIIITLIWFRLSVHGPGEERLIPTLWIVLGPLGQSVTAANLLGASAHLVFPPAEAITFHTLGIIYGVPVLGFALMWAVIASTITLRVARKHLSFSLTWWSFTFPIGTCATGATGLALATSSPMLGVLATVIFGALVAAWLTVAVRTARGVISGILPVAPRPLVEPHVAAAAFDARTRRDSGDNSRDQLWGAHLQAVPEHVGTTD
jgi:C4-dicarboxylate transporter/malic acid transport protein